MRPSRAEGHASASTISTRADAPHQVHQTHAGADRQQAVGCGERPRERVAAVGGVGGHVADDRVDGGPPLGYCFTDRTRLSLAEGAAAAATAALFAHPSEARLDPHVRSLAPAGFGEEDIIDIAPDRQTAMGAFHCTVHLEAAIGPSCPLVEMARQQGGGVVRRSERGVFETVYVRCDGMWKIQRSTYRAV